ncbi:SPOR domain-containing protein [Lewinella sp. JB7]|uniref:SPOR domain-containing protein n=1 Tax=Lewinella sp. JB7 TaxID=2962887 RepID=UPI0020CA0CC9|nr:SPOR domain-containing protein [Lewinella sp. JB7]MCP9237745.1 carboxypeptidase regulatory-like domain-containing protein [Lewinella sp. JB7]
MKYCPRLLAVLLTCGLALPLSAQFRTEKRTADKEFELHAYNLAIRSYQRALSYRDDDLETLSRLGDAYRMLNKLDSARLYYERATNNRRVEPATLLAYAHTLKALGEYERAQPLYLAYAREADATVGNHYARSCDFAILQRNEAAGFTVRPLGINSAASDFGPTIPRPGQFVFNSSRPDEDFSGVAVNRPYVAEVAAGGSLSAPVPVVFRYRVEGGSVGPVSYSPDATQVVFSRNNFTPGTRMVPEAGITLSLMIADVNEAGAWTNVRPLPVNGNDFNSGFGSFGADGNTIYFASDRPGGWGGYDLYRIRRVDNNWETTPENLGATVNTRGHEITPYFDGTSLYFSSNWHQGLGAYDVFRAGMESGRPGSLFHLGGAVNSPRDDMGFVYEPTTGRGYVVSNRNADTEEDIYAVQLEMIGPAPAAATTTTTAPTATVPEGVVRNSPVPYGRVRGYVSDIETSRPVADAAVTVTSRKDGSAIDIRTDTEGAYYLAVQPNTVYDVAVAAAGYEPMTFPVTTTASNNPDLFGNILLLPAQSAPPSAPTEVGAGEVAAPQTYDRETAPAPATSGFSVQLASVTAAPDLTTFGKLAAVGRVYTVTADGRYKVRLGTFATREAATAAAGRARELGYPGSFVVAETQGPLPADDPETAPAPAPTVTTTAAPFRVQLGAFGKPENVNREKAGALGQLRTEVRGALTVFYIDGLTSLSQAESVQRQALAAGFTGAYVLKLTDGKYVKP